MQCFLVMGVDLDPKTAQDWSRPGKYSKLYLLIIIYRQLSTQFGNSVSAGECWFKRERRAGRWRTDCEQAEGKVRIRGLVSLPGQ